MEYLYIVFLTLFISICCLKYFDVTVDKKNILLVIIISLCCCMINFLKLPDMLNTVIRDSLIYLFIRKYISKDRDLEIVSIILVLETIANENTGMVEPTEGDTQMQLLFICFVCSLNYSSKYIKYSFI